MTRCNDAEMSDSDRHINFKLMRDHILALQDGEDSRAAARNTGAVSKNWLTRPEFREFVRASFRSRLKSGTIRSSDARFSS